MIKKPARVGMPHADAPVATYLTKMIVTAQPALGASCRTERIDQDLRLLSDGLDYIPALLFGS